MFMMRLSSLDFGHAFLVPTKHSLRIRKGIRGTTQNRLYATNPKNVAIIGGGLAGLSTTYHLLKKSENLHITIFDKAEPGKGGASSVAGGLLHPFSPRGKLVHLGIEGLETTNNLINAAKIHRPDCILQDRIYRIALTEKNKDQLQYTADLHPQYAEWLSSDHILEQCKSGSSDSTPTLGGIRLSNGCKVVHVPAYLQGLWSDCQELSGGRATWSIDDAEAVKIDWKEKLMPFDTVVFAAGSGLFHDAILEKDAIDFPAQLIRGQSIEMTMPLSSDYTNEAMLCGKYLAPMTDRNKVLIGATHEFQADALNADEVQSELRKRSYSIAPKVWDEGRVDKITIGYRVQSQRGKYGRMPIIGKSIHNDVHDNTWIFTGLSSRGLIYHGVYGDLLSTAILRGDESVILEDHPDVNWWK